MFLRSRRPKTYAVTMQPGDAVPNFSSLACVNGEIVQLELASFQGLYTVVVFYEVNTNQPSY